jgi:hypothetical protein
VHGLSTTQLLFSSSASSKNPQLADQTAAAAAAAAVQKKFLQFSSNSSHVDLSAVISPEDFFFCFVGWVIKPDLQQRFSMIFMSN